MTEDNHSHHPGLKMQAARSVAWTSFAQVGAQAISLIGTPILARALMPEDFGVVVTVSILTGLVTLLGEFGLGAAIIYRQDVTQEHIATSYWFNIVIGALLTGITILGAPFAAEYFHNPLVRPVAYVLAFTFLINSFSWAHGCLMMKDLQFKAMAIINIGSIALRVIVSVVLAVYYDMGVWALVYGEIAKTIVSSIARFFAHPWRPVLAFHWDKFRELFSYGINLTGARIFDYFSKNVDSILIARLLNATQLGFYNFSTSMPNKVQYEFTQSINRVLFPVYCRVQSDNPRFGVGLVKTLRLIALISMPLLIGLMIVAEPFVHLYYGPGWDPVIAPLRVLCIAGIARAILGTNGAVLNAKGRPDVILWWSIVRLPLTVALIWFFAPRGVVGIATGVTIAAFASIVTAWIGTRLIELPFTRWLGALVPATVSTCVMAAVLLGVQRYALPIGASEALQLGILIPLGGLVYLAMVRTFYREVFEEILQTGLSVFRKE